LSNHRAGHHQNARLVVNFQNNTEIPSEEC
jgi:hypothetical protein